jgi:hypothetical protein
MDRSKQLLSAALLLCLAVGCQQGESPASGAAQSPAAGPVSSIVKVSALSNGEILLDGKSCTLDQFTARLAEAQKLGGEVYYYREAADQEPHPNAMTAMQRIAASHLPVSFSTLPDFSDYVDANGHSNPRP